MDLKEKNPEEKLNNNVNDVNNLENGDNKKDVTAEKEENIEKNTDNNAQLDEKNKKEKETIKKIKKIIKPISLTMKIITWILITVLLSILIMTVLSRKTDVFGHRIYLIVTGSMEPKIHMKDAVFTKYTEDVKEGDVIAFEQGNAVTVHRIVKVYTEGEKRLYQTKGDANNTLDKGLVQQNQIKGKVIATSTVMGNAIYWLQHNFIVFILIIGILLIILIIRRII